MLARSLVILSAFLCAVCDGQEVPFSFFLGGLPSSSILPTFRFSSAEIQLSGGRVQNTSSWWDASSGFWISSTAVRYPPVANTLSVEEWVISFGTNGSLATPPFCNVSPLNVSWEDDTAINGTTAVFRNLGSFASSSDYAGVNETLTTPGQGPPVPPILNSSRVWGDVFYHDTTTETPEACRDRCISDNAASCGGMAFSQISDPSLDGCWLVTSVTQITQQAGFYSWVSGNASSTTTWAPSGGRSSNGELPMFTAVAGGVGHTVSIGWSGNWAATVSRETDGSSRVSVSHPTLCTTLQPGDTLRSMRIMMVVFDATTPAAYHVGVNVHRRVMVDYKLPRDPVTGNLLGALVASWSWIGWPAPTLENQLWHVSAVKNSSSVEAYWLDAGWFNGGFPNGVGNWQLNLTPTVDAAEFPGSTLAPLGEAAHAEPNSVKFIVWFEPERVAAGTWIAVNKPSFLIPAGGDLLDLGNPAAWSYMHDYLSSSVGNYSLDVLRLDFNTDPAPNWAAADAPNRSGLVELRYIAGLYSLWDSVLAEHPGLLIDDCASGGRRIDFETLARSVPLWRSDNPGDSTQQQVQAMGLSGFAPISSGGVAWVDPYTWRSSGITGKTADWGQSGWETLMSNSTALATLRVAVAETQRLRAAAIFGDYYPLTPIVYDDTVWAAYQYHCNGGGTGCLSNDSGWVLVFRRPSTPSMQFHLSLFNIALDGAYHVRSYNESYAITGEESSVPGSSLAFSDVYLAPSSSLLVEYERVS